MVILGVKCLMLVFLISGIAESQMRMGLFRDKNLNCASTKIIISSSSSTSDSSSETGSDSSDNTDTSTETSTDTSSENNERRLYEYESVYKMYEEHRRVRITRGMSSRENSKSEPDAGCKNYGESKYPYQSINNKYLCLTESTENTIVNGADEVEEAKKAREELADHSLFWYNNSIFYISGLISAIFLFLGEVFLYTKNNMQPLIYIYIKHKGDIPPLLLWYLYFMYHWVATGSGGLMFSAPEYSICVTGNGSGGLHLGSSLRLFEIIMSVFGFIHIGATLIYLFLDRYLFDNRKRSQMSDNSRLLISLCIHAPSGFFILSGVFLGMILTGLAPITGNVMILMYFLINLATFVLLLILEYVQHRAKGIRETKVEKVAVYRGRDTKDMESGSKSPKSTNKSTNETTMGLNNSSITSIKDTSPANNTTTEKFKKERQTKGKPPASDSEEEEDSEEESSSSSYESSEEEEESSDQTSQKEIKIDTDAPVLNTPATHIHEQNKKREPSREKDWEGDQGSMPGQINDDKPDSP